MADDSIRLEYNQDLAPLEKLLEGVQRAGDFFATGVMEIPMPKVEVAGVGVLSFPVQPAQIAALIQHSTRAPYGRGEDTILDESVRKVWQLPPERVRISGKSWAASFDGILQQVIAGLGCEGMAVSAELYKLLVYDPDGFFTAHRDTEKTGGMFGTLVVALPSAHRGGALVIRHAGREAIVDLSGAEGSEVRFAAFYADCEHEVRPITQGHRVCLVYNLIQRRKAKGTGLPLRAPDYEAEIAAAARLLETYLTEAGAPAKIAWLFEHQYSPDGLAFSGLKATDAARAQVLAQAAVRAECATHLGIVHIEESGSAEPQYHDYGSRRWGRYHESRHEDDEYAGGDDFEVIDVSDWCHYIDQWRDLRDHPVEFGSIPIDAGELLPRGALDDEKPDRQRLREASGNEGASFERSYHRAALVIWRRERHADVLLQAGVAAVLPYLKERIETCCGTTPRSAARRGTVALARRLVEAWAEAPAYSSFQQPGRPNARAAMLRLLIDLGDIALLEIFIATVVTRDYDGSDNAALVASARLLGAEQTGRLLSEVARTHTPLLHEACVDLLQALASTRKAATTEKWQRALRQIGEAIVGQLAHVGKRPRENEWTDWRVAGKERAVNAALVANLLDVLAELGAAALRAEAAEQCVARPAVFDPVTILVPALGSIGAWDAAARRLWEHSADFLLTRSGRPPASPRDWRQDVTLSCACADCRELRTFVLHPADQTRRFRVRQDRRQHLEEIIEKHRLDMTHVTDRTGSPQTLVCTKDRRSYRRRCAQYQEDVAALAALVALGGQAGIASEWVERIRAARLLAAGWSPA